MRDLRTCGLRRLRALKLAFLLCASLAAALSLHAGQFDMSSLRTAFDTRLNDIILEHGLIIQDLHAAYADELNSLLKNIAFETNGVRKNIQAEADRFKRDQTILVTQSAGAPRNLARVQAAFANRLANLELDRARSVVSMVEEYLGKLKALEQKFASDASMEQDVRDLRSERSRVSSLPFVINAQQTAASASRRYAKSEPAKQPKPARRPRWHVIFLSSDPSEWKPEEFLSDVPDDIRYIRLRIKDQRDTVIAPITKALLPIDGPITTRYGWSGTAEFRHSAYHLGIYDRHKQAAPGGVSMRVPYGEERLDFPGWGFGHQRNVDDKQQYTWNGKTLVETVFEISVTSSDLTPQERWFLVKD